MNTNEIHLGRGSRKRPPKRILLVASPGGHMLQMLALEAAWHDLNHRWVTLPAADTDYLLADEEVIHAYGPTPRNVLNLIRNLWLAWQTVRAYEPDVILSTGAAIAVPFFIIGRLHRVRLIYVESFTRVQRLALSGRLVYPLSDAFFVQWSSTVGGRRAIYAGSVV
jgi:beta-1,4-N-acetylglucosaminyltransferase